MDETRGASDIVEPCERVGSRDGVFTLARTCANEKQEDPPTSATQGAALLNG